MEPTARPPRDWVSSVCWVLLILVALVAAGCAARLEAVFARLGLKDLPVPTALLLMIAAPVRQLWFVMIPVALAGAGYLWCNPFSAFRQGIRCGLAVAAFFGWMWTLLGLVMPLVELMGKLRGP